MCSLHLAFCLYPGRAPKIGLVAPPLGVGSHFGEFLFQIFYFLHPIVKKDRIVDKVCTRLELKGHRLDNEDNRQCKFYYNAFSIIDEQRKPLGCSRFEMRLLVVKQKKKTTSSHRRKSRANQFNLQCSASIFCL